VAVAVGEEAEAQAARLRFPGFTLEPPVRRYYRTGITTYQYRLTGDSSITDLQVNEAGFFTRYPDYWQIEETA